MRTLFLTYIAAFLAASVHANDGIDESILRDSPLQAAELTAPLWLFPSGTCLPGSAVINGKQNKGNSPDHCNIFKLNNHCSPQPRSQGQYTKLGSFPTYYMIRQCGDEYRILFDVYFTKDTGHRHDWEWAIIVLQKGADGKFYRNMILQEHEGKVGHQEWSDIPEAYKTDIHANDHHLGNHPKLYVGKFHHSIWTKPHKATFKATCPPNARNDYRSDDYYWAALDNLDDGGMISPDWTWGHADSYPANFAEGKKHDMCKK